MPSLEDLKVTTEDEGIAIHYSFGVSENSPQVFEITWSRNEQQLDMECDKFAGGSLHESCLFLKPPYNDGEGKYSCIVTNAVGSVKKDVMLCKYSLLFPPVMLYDNVYMCLISVKQ